MNEYSLFKEKASEIRRLIAVSGLLHWDREVNMPTGGSTLRSEQLAYQSAQIHKLSLDPQYEDLLRKLNEDKNLPEESRREVALALDQLIKNKRLTESFVIRESNAISNSFNAWLGLRSGGDEHSYLLALDSWIDVCREKAECLGYATHPYDAMLQQYEKDLTVALCRPQFEALNRSLYPIIKEYSVSSIPPPAIPGPIPLDIQTKFGKQLVESIGFDLTRGHLGISAHPFCLSMSPDDVRLTYHVREENPDMMVWGLLHEAGHGLYEQGLSSAHYGLAQGTAQSLIIHESLSRFWENHIGRSLAYWRYVENSNWADKVGFCLPKAEELYARCNPIFPSEIRIAADEVTYSMHILLRFEIEQAWISGKINTHDIPEYWNEEMQRLMGIKPKTPLTGYAQDVHWAHGSLGYFPTYTLGSMLAAQWEENFRHIGLWNDSCWTSEGLKALVHWFSVNVFSQGSLLTATELSKTVLGVEPNSKAYLSYIHRKFVRT
jgi:carboxypeptidase Taq